MRCRPCGGCGRWPGRSRRFNVNQFYKEEGVLALFDRGANGDTAAGGSDLTWQTQKVDGGTIFVQSGGSSTDEPAPRCRRSHLRWSITTAWSAARPPGAGEGRAQYRSSHARRNATKRLQRRRRNQGTDKADEIVLIGAHFDSWHGGTGATDNATGSAAMMEALRILKATGCSRDARFESDCGATRKAGCADRARM
jgi:hypothetical protein